MESIKIIQYITPDDVRNLIGQEWYELECFSEINDRRDIGAYVDLSDEYLTCLYDDMHEDMRLACDELSLDSKRYRMNRALSTIDEIQFLNALRNKGYSGKIVLLVQEN